MLVQKRQITIVPLHARAIALKYLALKYLSTLTYERSKICVLEIQSFLLLKHAKCLI